MANHEAFLRSALSVYRNADMAKRDIIGCIQAYADLRPQRDSFVFNDGSNKELLCLDGTLPVSYKGAIYNIPVCLWLLDTHPYNPPMVYVKPTTTMQIKPGRHVDNNGRVYLPYLHDWKHPESDLLGLAQVLIVIFSEEPPVFSRSAAAQRLPPPLAGPAAAGSANPPYPPQGSGMPMPSPSYPGAASTGYPPQYPGYPNQPPQPNQQASGYPGAGGYTAPGYPAYPPQHGYPPTSTVATTQSSTGTLPLSDEQIRTSLVSAVEDKMRRRLKEIFAQAQAEMDSLKRTQEDLNKGKKTLDDMMQKLEKEQNDLDRNTTLLKDKNVEMTTALAQMDNNEELNIDDAVAPTAPLYRQLLNTFAEEQATEDAIYYLGEAIRKGVIELDIFLKQVREMSRKQFLLRALINKCREKAGLPDISG